MDIKIPVSEKREFIKWLINRDGSKKSGIKHFFYFLLTEDYLLENILFVDSIEIYSRGIKVEIKDEDITNNVSMHYKEDNERFETKDPYLLFEKVQVRKRKEEVLYLEVNFKDKYLSKEYLRVRENTSEDQVEKEIEKEASLMLTEMELLKQIDAALDDKDEKLFNRLTKQLNQYNNVLQK